MPRTRSESGWEVKGEQILDAAERRLLEGGYNDMSVAGIARDLGIAQNSVYWYFPSKDHLFVAVLRRLLPRLMAAKPPARQGLTKQVLWFVARLDEFRPIIVSVHQRAQVSPVVAEFDRELSDGVRHLLTNALRSRLDPQTIELAVPSFLATVEGLLLQAIPRRERDRILTYTLEQILGAK